MLTNGKELFKDAREKGYAIGAFNATDHDTAETILKAAEDLGVPVVLQISDFVNPKSNKRGVMSQFDADNFMRYLTARAQASPVPVVIHLDHCKTVEGIIRAIKWGATSVMIDASVKSFEENIEMTREVVKLAHGCGVCVEAEIGHVGKNAGGDESIYTTPEEAKEFYDATGVDLLAVAIGTAHGVYKTTPVLQYDRIKEIKEAVEVPLVMHGASGLTEEQYAICVKNGICKINFSTYMQLNATKEFLRIQPESEDQQFRVLVKATKLANAEYLKQHMRYFGTIPFHK